MTGPQVDPVLVKRARVARLTSLAIKAGSACYLVATALFFYAVSTGFTDLLAGALTVLLIAGSVLLAPAMVIHYAVKAADRADREGSW